MQRESNNRISSEKLTFPPIVRIRFKLVSDTSPEITQVGLEQIEIILTHGYCHIHCVVAADSGHFDASKRGKVYRETDLVGIGTLGYGSFGKFAKMIEVEFCPKGPRIRRK